MYLWSITIFSLLVAIYLAICIFYYVAQERFIFVRFKVSRNYEFKFKQRFDEFYLAPEQGVELHALHFRVPEPKGLVLYFHGNTGSLRRWGKQAPLFTELGFEVLMPDHRGYGKSRGPCSEQALINDALAWYEKATELCARGKTVVYGRSLGSGMATPVAALDQPGALVLETPFANLLDVARNYSILLPYRILLRYRFRNDRAMPQVKCPVFIFHGEKDRVVPYKSALDLYAKVDPEVYRKMITFPKGRHSGLTRYRKFRRELKRILDEVATGSLTSRP